MAAGERCWTLQQLLLLLLVTLLVRTGAAPQQHAARAPTEHLASSTDIAVTTSPSSTDINVITSSSSTDIDVTTLPSSTDISVTASPSSTGINVTSPPTSTESPVLTSTSSPNIPCPDPHSHPSGVGIGDNSCTCNEGYNQTSDPDRQPNNGCRVSRTGHLGHGCNDVSDCNYRIHHVVCETACRCRSPYTGFNGETTCFDNAMGWSVAIRTAGITVLVLAIGFFIAFGIKGCSRHRLRRRIPWLRRNSDISFHSDDFYVGTQAILDRPPSYAEEDTDKPPAYDEVFPELQLPQGGIVNAGFSPDSAHQEPRDRRPAGAEGAPPPPPPPLAVAASAAPAASAGASRAGRGHRRGLSGPAAIHLGTTEEAAQTSTPDGISENSSRTAADKQTSETGVRAEAPDETTEAGDRAEAPDKTTEAGDRAAAAEDAEVRATAVPSEAAEDTSVSVPATPAQSSQTVADGRSDGPAEACLRRPPLTAGSSNQPPRVPSGGERVEANQCVKPADNLQCDAQPQLAEVWEDIQL